MPLSSIQPHYPYSRPPARLRLFGRLRSRLRRRLSRRMRVLALIYSRDVFRTYQREANGAVTVIWWPPQAAGKPWRP